MSRYALLPNVTRPRPFENAKPPQMHPDPTADFRVAPNGPLRNEIISDSLILIEVRI